MPLLGASLLPLAVLAFQKAWPEEIVNHPSFDSATVYATVGLGEWCSEGSVYIDLWSGEYMLSRRTPRPDCADNETRRQPERGTLSDEQLAQVRAANRRLWIEGPELEKDECTISVINSGPHVLIVTGAQYNLYAMDNTGCWTEATWVMHRLLDEMFDGAATLHATSDLEGRRIVEEEN